MNYFELYPGDYLRDTTRLTLVEHGAYLRLLMAYYAEEQPLPGDEAELYVIVSAVTPTDKAAVRKVAGRFFPVGDDGLRRNGRADLEIAKARKRIETSRANGAKGGRKPRGQRPNPPATGNPAGNPPGSPQGGPVGTRQRTCSGEASPHATRHVPKEGIHTPPSAERSGGAEDLARALRAAGFEQCSAGHPEILAAAQAGVTAAGMAAAAIGFGDKSVTYIARRAVGQLRDAAAAQSSQASNGVAVPAPMSRDASAERDWRGGIEAEIIDIRHQCDTLGAIEPAVRDERIAVLRQTLAAGWPGRQEAAR